MQDGHVMDDRITAKVVQIDGELAVRLSPQDAMRLGLKEGDEVEVRGHGQQTTDRPAMTREEGLAIFRKYRGIMPAGYRFDREDANERRPHDQD